MNPAIQAICKSVLSYVRERAECSGLFEWPQGCILSPELFSYFFINEVAIGVSLKGKYGRQTVQNTIEFFFVTVCRRHTVVLQYFNRLTKPTN